MPRDLDGQIRSGSWRVRDEESLETSADRPQLPEKPCDIERPDVAVLAGLLRELLGAPQSNRQAGSRQGPNRTAD